MPVKPSPPIHYIIPGILSPSIGELLLGKEIVTPKKTIIDEVIGTIALVDNIFSDDLYDHNPHDPWPKIEVKDCKSIIMPDAHDPRPLWFASIKTFSWNDDEYSLDIAYNEGFTCFSFSSPVLISIFSDMLTDNGNYSPDKNRSSVAQIDVRCVFPPIGPP
jgi:hypothetical protein